MSHIFVSHASKDDERVSKIHDALEATGIPAWVDHKDELKAGGNWSGDIQTALNDCRAGLFVLSPTSAKSPECEAEYRRILSLGKTLYVALIAPVSKADFPWRLTTIQYVDLQADFDAGMRDLIHAIQHERDLDPASPTTGHLTPISGQIDPRHMAIPLSGRDTDVDALKNLLKNAPTALLGMGGLGKSRLAAELVMTSDIDGAIWHTAAIFPALKK